MLGGTIINIEILVGLPGSGKTYYAKEATPHSVYQKVLDFDKYKDKYPSLENVIGIYNYNDILLYNPESLVICDGLFLTNEAQENLVKEWIVLFNKEGGETNKSNKLNIKFVYFKENRDGCLNNDSYRKKDRHANITIKHSPFEKPNIEALKDKFKQENINFKLEEKEVYVMDKYEGTFKTLRNDYWSEKLGKDVMASKQWSMGGTWGDCWGNSGDISPDEAPKSFDEFDKLLEKYCPDITFLKYKKIYNECVTIEEDRECDYYGGIEYFNCYCCDLERLYDMLTELGYLTEEEA